MKSILFIGFLAANLLGRTQTWASYSYESAGFPVSASFPAKPGETLKPSNNDTMLTLMASANGTTYALICTKTKSEQVATASLPGAVKKITGKAKKMDGEQTSVIGGKTSTRLQYLSQKDAYVISHSFSNGRIFYQAMVLKMKGYASEQDCAAFFNSISFTTQSNNQNNGQSTTTQVTPVNSTSTNPSGTYAVYDRIEVFDSKENKWYGAIVLKVNVDGSYRVAYDGYADTYDEDVKTDRIRASSSATTPANIPYVRVKKGGTVKLNGNLRNGTIMEDLEWATTSQMACWPSIRDVEFEGNHVAYWFDLPKKSIVKITVTPRSTKHRINLYGYSSVDFKHLPPNAIGCSSCEASHPTWIGQPNLNEPSVPQSIELNTTTRHTTVYFAVAGAKGVVEGDYEVTIEIK
ncbi:MAG TPA: hypothetical protein VK177_08175 [Flavobacteriales bacterium]|nr:hypothetical protein [Flavobacteriales bacterium]